MKNNVLFALFAAAALAAGGAAANPPPWAGHGKNKEEKHGKAAKHEDRADVKPGTVFSDQHREFARTYYGDQYGKAKSCPPGLAKKNNGCMPPGQAKKLVVGQPVPTGVTYYQVPQPVLVQLPPPPAPGYRYVRIGNDIVLLSPQSSVVVDVIAGLLR
jgi:Ni/Co efflux regulator RcnB